MSENTNPFAGLEDESVWTQEHLPPAEDAVEIPGFVENCPKCGGSGNYRGMSRHGHKCFKCKGTGKLSFKTSPEQRARGRKSAAAAKERKAQALSDAFDTFLRDECPDVGEWLRKRGSCGDNFAQSLIAGGKKYGHLTEGQVAAVRNSIARDSDSAEGFDKWCESHEGVLEWLTTETEKGNEFAGSVLRQGKHLGSLSQGQLNAVLGNIAKGKRTEDEASELNLDELVKGYYAVPDGDTRLKVAIRRPGKNSRWHGWTFVDDGAAYGSRRTYGKQAPDSTYAGAIQDQLRAIIANPLEAMIEYGKLTGTCGKCGRILEDEDSVAAGIGPVCASKMS